MNEVLSGKSMSEVRGIGAQEVCDALSSPLAHVVIDELMACVDVEESGRAHRLGISSLLNKPEFSNAAAALLGAAGARGRYRSHASFRRCRKLGQSPRGAHRQRKRCEPAFRSVSVVAAQYGPSDASGVVAVIGPTRMDYSKVIKAVRAARRHCATCRQ
ncbi:MAG: hypothetical protein ACLT98_03250 [Eggerthellaceae bacterium]